MERFESLPVNESQVVEILKEKGLEDAEAHEGLLKLYEQYQQEADIENTSIANLKAGVRLAKIYAQAGLKSEALVSLEELRLPAQSEGPEGKELLEEISRLIEEIQAA